jgi:ribosome maturation protein SDO1
VIKIGSGNLTFTKEKVSFNLARHKTHGKTYEVAVDPDLAILYKENLNSKNKDKQEKIDIREILKSEDIFYDVSKGELASENEFNDVFGTIDTLKIAETILIEGEIQITSELRAKIRDAKRKKIIDIIHRNGIDPRTNLPHPTTRIETVLLDSKIKIDEFKRAEDQVEDIVKQINSVIPIRFETRKVQVKVYSEYANKIQGFLRKYKILTENWNSDGSYTVILEIPAGIQNDFFDKLNSLTQGGNETNIVE